MADCESSDECGGSVDYWRCGEYIPRTYIDTFAYVSLQHLIMVARTCIIRCGALMDLMLIVVMQVALVILALRMKAAAA